MFRFVSLLSVGLIAGCASTQNTLCNLLEPDSYVFVSVIGCDTIEVSLDYDAEAGFTALKAYDWLSAQTVVSADPAKRDDDPIHEWVIAAVDVRLAQRGFKRNGETPDFLVSYDVPAEPQGTLTLEIVSPQERSVIWRGTALDRGYPSRSPEGREARVQVAVDRLLEQFPPAP